MLTKPQMWHERQERRVKQGADLCRAACIWSSAAAATFSHPQPRSKTSWLRHTHSNASGDNNMYCWVSFYLLVAFKPCMVNDVCGRGPFRKSSVDIRCTGPQLKGIHRSMPLLAVPALEPESLICCESIYHEGTWIRKCLVSP